jgi:hypothetical protein
MPPRTPAQAQRGVGAPDFLTRHDGCTSGHRLLPARPFRPPAGPVKTPVFRHATTRRRRVAEPPRRSREAGRRQGRDFGELQLLAGLVEPVRHRAVQLCWRRAQVGQELRRRPEPCPEPTHPTGAVTVRCTGAVGIRRHLECWCCLRRISRGGRGTVLRGSARRRFRYRPRPAPSSPADAVSTHRASALRILRHRDPYPPRHRRAHPPTRPRASIPPPPRPSARHRHPYPPRHRRAYPPRLSRAHPPRLSRAHPPRLSRAHPPRSVRVRPATAVGIHASGVLLLSRGAFRSRATPLA